MKLRKQQNWRLLFLIGILVAVGWYLGQPELSPVVTTINETDLRQQLLQEFTGAYPAEVELTNQVRELELVAAATEISLPGQAPQQLWTYNGTIPGPEIRLTKGETLRLHFTNKLPQPTTIHFHGIRVPNAMDGVPGVTQPPIEPGESFVYEFTPKDAGTFWYHPHVRGSEQVERGLYGSIIVEDPAEPVYTADRVLVLDDWRLLQTGQLDPRFNSGHDLMHDGRWGNLITVNGQVRPEIPAAPGARLRLRLINSSNGRVYRLDTGSLDAKVIAVDGLLVDEVVSAQDFEVAPGNRLDVDVMLPSSTTDGQRFFIKDTFTRQPQVLFSLAASGSALTTPTFEPPTASHPLDWQAASSLTTDHTYRLNARRGGPFGIEWTINDQTMADAEPITLQAENLNILTYANDSYRLHPMHIHGQFFRVLSRNGQPALEPFWRDTVLIHPQETVTVGLVPLDRGTWANHCHILEHAEAGMMTTIQVE